MNRSGRNSTQDEPVAYHSFLRYLYAQKPLFVMALAAGITGYLLLRYCFPFPDFFADSFSYVKWAARGLDYAYRPTGYSVFLTLLHGLSAAAGLPVAMQYFFFWLSTFFCFLSADYLFGIPARARWPLLLCSLLDPLLIIQANVISSDSLFCSLTVCWFTSCLWIVKKQNWCALAIQLVFLFLCFQVRYTALFFPIIAACAILASRSRWLYKTAGIGLTVAVVLFCMERQKNIALHEYGAPVFSGFSGWQMANNVLCYYKELNVDEHSLPSKECQVIDQFVVHYIDSMYRPGYVGADYIWAQASPLKKYLVFRVNSTHNVYFKEWLQASVPLGQYGWALFRQDPLAYFRYFVLPNTWNYCYPDREFLTSYNCTDNPMPAETREWYHFATSYLYCPYPQLQQTIIAAYPLLTIALHLFTIVTAILFLLRLRARKEIVVGRAGLFLTWCVFSLGYMAFSVFAAVVSLRYLDPLFVLGVIIPFVLLPLRKSKSQS